MAQQQTPKNQQNHFRKWLRYYVDFCRKYKMPNAAHASLNLFCDKLREKQQSETLIQQARNAVGLYYSMLEQYKQGTETPLATDHHLQTEVNALQAANCASDWCWIYTKLEEQIRVRHYLYKTLRSYKGWVRQLQSFVASKDAATLGIEDIKAFLSYLALEKKVAAANQNQAFNGLLFLFRHVLGKEFGKIHGVVRAIQKLRGHSNLQTTMIYTHTVPDTTNKVAMIPLDF